MFKKEEKRESEDIEEQREKEKEAGEKNRAEGRRVKGANGRNWIPLMAARDRFWLSESRRATESE